MIHYLCIGLGVHFGLSVARKDSFQAASPLSIARGFIGCLLLWPLGLFYIGVIE